MFKNVCLTFARNEFKGRRRKTFWWLLEAAIAFVLFPSEFRGYGLPDPLSSSSFLVFGGIPDKEPTTQQELFLFRDANSIKERYVSPSNLSSQVHWRVALNEFCQLPNFRRPTNNPKIFAECVPLSILADNEDSSRKDLGIWTLQVGTNSISKTGLIGLLDQAIQFQFLGMPK